MTFEFDAGYRGQVTVVNTKNALFTQPESCKDYVHDAIMWGIFPAYAKKRGTYNVKRKGSVNLNSPTFVLWTSPKNVERNSIKFMQFINQLESIMGLSRTIAHPVTTGITGKSAPFVAEADPWWMKSPIAVSAYFLFLRLSITMKLNETFEDFIESAIKKKAQLHAIQRDINYLCRAKDKGHITGLLEKSLPCFNREDYSDYLLSTHNRGFSQYSLRADEKIPMTIEKLNAYVSDAYGCCP